MTVHVIGEAGTNHGGSLERGRELIDIAAAAGCDSVKFQIIHPDGLYLSDLWVDGELVHNDVFDARTAAMLPDEQWKELAAWARAAGIGFGASVFDARGIQILEDVEADYIKIASCDFDNVAHIEQAAATGLPVIVSTGMSSSDDVAAGAQRLRTLDCKRLIVMHCVSMYPCPPSEAAVTAVNTLRELGFETGYSDHTETNTAGVMAVALGATWLEKHFTYDRGAVGFDHSYAMTPSMLKDYVDDVRTAAAAMAGDRSTLPDPEREIRTRARRGLWASRDLAAGTVLSADDILVVRPQGPLGPKDLPRVVGRSLTSSLRRAEAISEDLLGPN